jgi:hypothetical protein
MDTYVTLKVILQVILGRLRLRGADLLQYFPHVGWWIAHILCLNKGKSNGEKAILFESTSTFSQKCHSTEFYFLTRRSSCCHRNDNR